MVNLASTIRKHKPGGEEGIDGNARGGLRGGQRPKTQKQQRKEGRMKAQIKINMKSQTLKDMPFHPGGSLPLGRGGIGGGKVRIGGKGTKPSETMKPHGRSYMCGSLHLLGGRGRMRGKGNRELSSE